MPLYDWENGVYHPHKKVYDWENGVYHPHQKVYDWENNVYHLHWQDERVILNDADSGEGTGGWVNGKNYIDNPDGL